MVDERPPGRSATLRVWALRAAPYAAIALLALAVRGAYLWQIKDTPLVAYLLGDSQIFDSWARQIAGGDVAGAGVFYMAPLYPYVLGAIYALFGRDPMNVRLVQIGLGATSCVLVALAGREFFSRGAGLAAGLLLALYPPAIFFDGLLQKSSFDLLFVAISLLALGRSLERPTPARFATIGGALALLVLVRENAAVLLPLALGFALLHHRERPLQVRLGWTAAVAGGMAVAFLPFAVRNARVTGQFTVTTPMLGANLFAGNSASSNGLYAPLRPERGHAMFEPQDAKEVAEEAVGRPLKPAEVSRYWMRRAFADVSADPGRWLRLMGRKWALIWNSVELAETEDLYTYAAASSVLRGLGTILHFGVLCPLAAVGLVAAWAGRRRTWILYAALPAYAASVALFFVFGRYRYPMVPFLVLFAGAGLVALRPLLRERRPWLAATAAAGAVAVAVFSNWPVSLKADQSAVTRYNLAYALAGDGRLADAIAEYRRAVALKPDFVEAHSTLAQALLVQGRPAEAIVHLAEAARLEPGNARAHMALAATLERAGRAPEALPHWEQAASLHPSDPAPLLALGRSLESQGRAPEALRAFGRALELAPDSGEAKAAVSRLAGSR